MKNIIYTIIVIIATTGVVFSQQQPHNTQFMYYKLGYNPGYAGSQEAPCITCIYRQQWVGLDGAPSMQIASFNMPLSNQRVGIGANLFRHTIGISTMVNLDGVYAYRIRLGKGMLGVGLQASIRSMRHDFSKTTATQPKAEDPGIPGDAQDKLLFNFGTGLYYSAERFYFGVSAPRLLENNIDYTDSDVITSREVQHLYMMGGFIVPISQQVKLQPQMLLKYVANAPIDLDANLNLLIQNRYVIGMTYRFGGNEGDNAGESLDVLLSMQLNRQLMFGMSYDFTLSDIKNYASGSIEASLHYCFGKSDPGKEYVNPRFF
jgi:type IX secretion system PorP/SprF family membrane protein